MVASQSSSVSSSIGRAMSTPALLTRTPISPERFGDVVHHGGDLRGVGDVGGAAGRLDARRAELRHQRIDLAAVRAQTPTR